MWMLLSCVISLCPADAPAGTAYDRLHAYCVSTSQHATHTYLTNLGPTGAMGWVYKNRIYIESVAPGSPAHGLLRRGDYLLGVSGRPFPDIDPRAMLGRAITAAEAADGKLALRVGNKEKERSVVLQLRPTGSYSPTWPYDCKKSAAIRDSALRWLRDHQKADATFGNSVYTSMNGLFLLSSPRPEDREAARRCVYGRLDGPPADCLNAWSYGYSALLLAEYFLATGDSVVLDRLKFYAREIGEGQTHSGGWCHGMSPNGVPGGYGEMNSAGVNCLLALVLARECGLAVDARSFKRATRFFGRFAGLGYVPYGNHRPWTGSPNSNGRNAVVALAFGILGESEKARAFAESVPIGYRHTEAAHTGCFWGVTWRPLGAVHAGREAFHKFLNEQLWYYELQRRWDGGLKYLPNPENLTGFTGFSGGPMVVTGGYGLTYALPWRSLRILGGTPGPFSRRVAPFLKPAVKLFRDKRWEAFDQKMAAWRKQSLSAMAARQVRELAAKRAALQAQIDWTLSAVEKKANQAALPRADIDRAGAMLGAVERLAGEDLAKAGRLRERLAAVKATPDRHTRGKVDRRNWKPLLPLARDRKAADTAKTWRVHAWTGEVSPVLDNLEPAGEGMKGWYLPDFDDSSWQEKAPPFRAHDRHKADLVAHPVSHHSEMYQIRQLYHAYARLDFDVEDASAVKAARIVQQNCHQYLRAEVYLNGYRVAAILRPNTCELSDEAVKLLRKGRNSLALYLASNRGHLHDFDFGLEVVEK